MKVEAARPEWKRPADSKVPDLPPAELAAWANAGKAKSGLHAPTVEEIAAVAQCLKDAGRADADIAPSTSRAGIFNPETSRYDRFFDTDGDVVRRDPNDGIIVCRTAEKDRIGDAAARKAAPVATGVIDYFPDALVAIAALSKLGNEQHNPGTPLHWDRAKSGDEGDCLIRHFIDRGTFDTDGVRHSAKMAWRALALLQKEIEADRS